MASKKSEAKPKIVVKKEIKPIPVTEEPLEEFTIDEAGRKHLILSDGDEYVAYQGLYGYVIYYFDPVSESDKYVTLKGKSEFDALTPEKVKDMVKLHSNPPEPVEFEGIKYEIHPFGKHGAYLSYELDGEKKYYNIPEMLSKKISSLTEDEFKVIKASNKKKGKKFT
jgi:hypothetical protein